jgi:aspartyl-tRNA(Asn)/glutamyl-tRNA(Gln) amidotransferase subunit A
MFAMRNKKDQVLSQIGYFGVAQLTAQYRTGKLSPVEVAREMLRRLDAFNGRLNAFSQVQPELTLAQAADSERRWMRGESLGPLDGVPFSVKDTLVAKGFATRRGSRVTSDAPARDSAPIVDRLLEQGGVMLGITTTPEFGGGPVTISPLTGVTRNPWDLEMTPGGSSGGGAAAVAAGIGCIALATDAGGSIRTPAALTGIVGFKPTAGRVPTYPGNVAGGLSSPGALTRSVEDAAIVLGAMAREDVRDPDALPPGATDYMTSLEEGVSGLRVAFSPALGYAREVHSDVAAAVREAARVLGSLGARVEEVDPPISDPLSSYKAMFMAGYAHSLGNLAPEQAALLGPTLRDIVARGREVTLTQYLQALDARRALAATMAQFHETYDLLLTPTVAVPAFPAERWQPEEFEKYDEPRAWVPFGYPFNLTQQPAASVPCGFTSGGLPVGMQIVGRRFDDALVLRAARAFEAATDWAQRRPPLFS